MTISGDWFEPIKSYWITSYGSEANGLADVSKFGRVEDVGGLGVPTTVLLVLAMLAGLSIAANASATASGDGAPRRGLPTGAAYALAVGGLTALVVRLFIHQPRPEQPMNLAADVAASSLSVAAELTVSTIGFIGLAGAVLTVVGTGLQLRAVRASTKAARLPADPADA